MRILFCILVLIGLVSSQTRVVGPACVGKCGMPPLLTEETLPQLGTDYCVEIYSHCACVGKLAAQVLWIGNAAGPGAGIEVPLDWTSGCSRWFTAVIIQGSVFKSSSRWCLTLPSDPQFLGVEILLQGIVLRTYCDDTREILTTRTIGVTLREPF